MTGRHRRDVIVDRNDFARCRTSYLTARHGVDITRWLSTGAVTFGVGAALITGGGVAHAQENEPESVSSIISAEVDAQADDPNSNPTSTSPDGIAQVDEPTASPSTSDEASVDAGLVDSGPTSEPGSPTPAITTEPAVPTIEPIPPASSTETPTSATPPVPPQATSARSTAPSDPDVSDTGVPVVHAGAVDDLGRHDTASVTSLPAPAPSWAPVSFRSEAYAAAWNSQHAEAPVARTFTVPTATVAPAGFSDTFSRFFGLSSPHWTAPDAPATASPFFALVWGLSRRFSTQFSNQKPTASPYGQVSSPGGIVTGNVGGSDPEGDPLVYSVGTPPTEGTVTVSVDGTYVYIANPTLAASGGTDSFTIVISDADAGQHFHSPIEFFSSWARALTNGSTRLDTHSTRVVVPVTVVASNAAPVAGTPMYELAVDPTTGVVTGQIRVTDPDGDVVRYELATPVESSVGTVTVDAATGSFTFAPTLQSRYTAFGSSTVPTVVFSVTASDGTSSTNVVVTAPIAPRDPALDRSLDPDVLKQLIASGVVQVSENNDGTTRIIDGRFVDTTVDSIEDAVDVLNRIAGLLGAPSQFASNAEIGTKVVKLQRRDGSTYTETYYIVEPTRGGVPVVGSNVVLAVGGDGMVVGVYSTYDSALASVDTRPSTSIDTEEEVVEAIKNIVIERSAGKATEAELLEFLSGLSFVPELVVYSPGDDVAPRLAWRVVVDDLANSSRTTLILGANGSTPGAVLSVDSGILGATGLEPGTRIALDAWGVPRVIIVTPNDQGSVDSYTFSDPVRNLSVYFDQQKTEKKEWNWLKLDYDYATVPYTPKGGLATATAPSPRAVSALANVAEAYDFYVNQLQYDFSDKEKNRPKKIYILPTFDITAAFGYTTGDVAAFAFGYGSEAALDIAAHEFTHYMVSLIVGNGSGLNGSREALSLSEAYADILGALIENKSGDGKYDIGEDIRSCTDRTPGHGCALRNIGDPSEVDGSYRTDYSELEGSEKLEEYRGFDQYRNSTIFSNAVAVMMEDPRSSALTNEAWQQIVYHSLYKLNPKSTFADARSAMISSAKAYGLDRTEIEAMQDAFDAAGISATNYRYGAAVQVPLGASNPRDVVINGAGDRAFVLAGNGTVRIVNTRAVPVPVVSSPVSIAGGATNIAVLGRYAFVTSANAGTLTIIEDTYDGDPVITTLNIGGSPNAVAVSADGNKVFVTNRADSTVTVVDRSGATPVVSSTVRVGVNPTEIAVSSNGSRAFVLNANSNTVSIVVDGGASPTQTVSVVGSPRSVVTSADGTRALVYTSNGLVTVIDLSGGTPVARILDRSFASYEAVGFMAISDDGKRAWITNHTTKSTVVYVDFTTEEPTLKAFDLEDLAHSVSTTEDGRRAFIVTHGELFVIDLRGKKDLSTVTPFKTNIKVNNNASEYQQVAVSDNGAIVVATDIEGNLTVLYGTAF